MRDHADPLHNIIESTKKYCSLLSGLVGGLIPKICTVLAGSERENHLMAHMDPIDISSSDSEVDDRDLFDFSVLDAPLPRESSTSNNQRILPAWATASVPSLTGRGGSSQNVRSLTRAPSSNGGSSNFYSRPVAKPLMLPSSSDNFSSLTPHITRDNNPNHFNGYGRGESSQNIPSFRRAQVSNGSSSELNHNSLAKLEMWPSSSDNEAILSSHIAPDSNSNHFTGNAHVDLKRNLPLSLLPSVSKASSINLNGQPHPNGSNPYYGTNYKKEHLGMGSDDIVFMYEKVGNRVLPPSLIHGKSVPVTQHASSSDPVHRPGVAETAVENDERLVYQAALQELNQSRVEATLPDGLLSVSLLRHQKIALAWMIQKETNTLHCSGGILADDQGLGKTISMIALIQMQKFSESKPKPDDKLNVKAEALNLDDDDDDDDDDGDYKQKAKVEASTSFQTRRPAAGTLVVCPASVLRQWARELDEKVASESKLSVLIYHGSNRTRDPIELAKYDVVLTTYAIVMNEVPKQVDSEDEDKSNGERFGISSEFAATKKRKKVSNGSKKGKKGKKGSDSSLIDYSSGALARVGWLRVILDEAQTIKNHRTQMAKACCGLRAKRRWCLSGTPIQNAIDELFSYFRFLRYDPYATFTSFCSSIKNPISRNPVQGYKKLQAVLRAIMLRRTKGTFIDGEPIINLPSKTINLAKVDFSYDERDFYNKLEADSQSQFKAYAAAGTVSQNYANILLMLLRLRQACDHRLLVKGFGSDSSETLSGQMAKSLPIDAVINLFNLLQTSVAICGVCNDPPEDAVITMCGHVFCYQCVSEYLQGEDHTCPSLECKEQLTADTVFSEAILRSCISDDVRDDPSSLSESDETSIVPQNECSSSKIRVAMQILQSHCKAKRSILEMNNLVHQNGNYQAERKIPISEMDNLVQQNGNYQAEGKIPISAMDNLVQQNGHSQAEGKIPISEMDNLAQQNGNYQAEGKIPISEMDNLVQQNGNSQDDGPIKAIVFSQWTKMLDLMELSLKQSSLQYRRLDGTMSLPARDKAVKEFNTDPEVTVMLMSLKAGNLGLNMVSASHVILLDLWWNPTTEDQAIDRAHRIGQTRPVTVSRMTIKDTVEDRILALQEEKRKMVASAFGEDHSGGTATRLTVDDLKYLFMI